MKLNLRKFREAHGKNQLQMASILGIGLRQYQRHEAAGTLTNQLAKTFALIIKMNEMHGDNYMKADFSGIKLSASEVNKIIKNASSAK